MGIPHLDVPEHMRGWANIAEQRLDEAPLGLELLPLWLTCLSADVRPAQEEQDQRLGAYGTSVSDLHGGCCMHQATLHAPCNTACTMQHGEAPCNTLLHVTDV